MGVNSRDRLRLLLGLLIQERHVVPAEHRLRGTENLGAPADIDPGHLKGVTLSRRGALDDRQLDARNARTSAGLPRSSRTILDVIPPIRPILVAIVDIPKLDR